MPFGKSTPCECKECGVKFLHAKKLSEHFKKHHKISPEDYVIKHSYEGIRPLCMHCNAPTRYVSLTSGFKRYCNLHSSVAESEGGKIGGKLCKNWLKGKTKLDDPRIAALAIKQSGEGNGFFGKKHTEMTLSKIASKKRLSFSEVIARIADNAPNVDVLSAESDYIDQNTLLVLKCRGCDTESSASLFNIQRCWSCRTCNPNASKDQMDVVNYVKSIVSDDVIVSTRAVIPPFELDVWIPAKNVAIEYHGLYWHSGGKDGVFDKKRHRLKHLQCKNKGIRLLQFFSDEWLFKQEICKSMIANALGVNTMKLSARDCSIREISTSDASSFLEENHVSGYTRSSRKVGLVHPTHGLVGVVTLRKPIQKRWGSDLLEIARMAFKQNTNVRGGASKLLSHVIETSTDCEGILTYADLRLGTGNVYQQCGFSAVGESEVNYWYTDGINRFDRFKYRAQSGLSEASVAATAGVRPVYGCGNAVFRYLHQNSVTWSSSRPT